MFYGAKILPNKSVTPSPEDGGEILHVSQVCLVEPTDSSPTYLQVEAEGKSYCVCVLQKGKEESVTTDLFVSTQQNLRLSTKGGKNEVHVVGYFEPDGVDGRDEEDEDEEDDLAAAAMARRRKVKGLPMGKAALGDDDDDDDDDDESLLDDDEDDDDDDESGDEHDVEEDVPKVMEITEAEERAAKMLESLPSPKEDEGEDDEDWENYDEDDGRIDKEILEKMARRDKAENAGLKNGVTGKRPMAQQQQQQHQKGQQQPNKKAKTSNAQQQPQGGKGGSGASNGAQQQPSSKKSGGGGGGEKTSSSSATTTTTSSGGGSKEDKESFRQQLVAYLKKNGRTALGVLGQKVKKPASVAEKLGKIIKDNPKTFNVENGFVSVG